MATKRQFLKSIGQALAAALVAPLTSKANADKALSIVSKESVSVGDIVITTPGGKMLQIYTGSQGSTGTLLATAKVSDGGPWGEILLSLEERHAALDDDKDSYTASWFKFTPDNGAPIEGNISVKDCGDGMYEFPVPVMFDVERGT